MMQEPIADRALAAFLGLAVGDALGATVEFVSREEIRTRHGVLRDIVGGGWLRLRAGAVTDDTEMSLALARSLVRRGGLDPLDLCEEFARWLRSGPVDVGHTCRRGIRRFLVEGTVAGPVREGDAGNGAAMRVLPVALATRPGDERAARWTLAQAHVTHHHPLSDAAALALVDMVGILVAGGVRADVRERAEALVEAHPEFAFTPWRGRAGAHVVETLQTVFDVFFSENDFETTVIETVARGDDADTTGAIAGMLAGAAHGVAAIPRRWLRALDHAVRAEIDALVPALLAIGGSPPLPQES
jgi:ADP-ribosyl-[dinitrogen reductase] hydrolase